MQDDDPLDHPALTGPRNTCEGSGTKKSCRIVKVGRKTKKAWKRKAGKQARRAAKDVLKGVRPRTKKRPGDSWDLA